MCLESEVVNTVSREVAKGGILIARTLAHSIGEIGVLAPGRAMGNRAAFEIRNKRVFIGDSGTRMINQIRVFGVLEKQEIASALSALGFLDG